MKEKVIILMGSKADLDFSKKIGRYLEDFGIEYKLRIASAHKTPRNILDILEEYKDERIVYIAVAGRSNALSGFVDANTIKPVIACPPYSDKFSGGDIYSSLRMPSAVAPMVVLEPDNAALAAAKILGLTDKRIQEKIKNYQTAAKEALEKDDQEVQDG